MFSELARSPSLVGTSISRAVVLGKDQPVDSHLLSPPASSPSSPCPLLQAEVSKIPEARLQDALLALRTGFVATARVHQLRWAADCGQGAWLRADLKENRVMGQMFYFSEVSKAASAPSALLKTSSSTSYHLFLAFERCYLLMSGSADTGTSSQCASKTCSPKARDI